MTLARPHPRCRCVQRRTAFLAAAGARWLHQPPRCRSSPASASGQLVLLARRLSGPRGHRHGILPEFHYDQPSDLPETLDYARMGTLALGLARAIGVLAAA